MKTWTMRKKKEAVSPVIATILMVAITVVLAAVLYVMVMGFGGDTNSTPTASLTPSGDHLVLTISEAQTPGASAGTGGPILFKIDGGATLAAVNLEFDSTDLGGIVGLAFVDAGGDTKISSGDYFTYSGSLALTVTIIYTSGGTNTPLADNPL